MFFEFGGNMGETEFIFLFIVGIVVIHGIAYILSKREVKKGGDFPKKVSRYGLISGILIGVYFSILVNFFVEEISFIMFLFILTVLGVYGYGAMFMTFRMSRKSRENQVKK